MARDRTLPPTTLDELRQNLAILKLHAMAEALDDAIDEANALKQGYVTFLANIVAKELLTRTDAAAERRCKAAGFPEIKTFEGFDWTFQPQLNVQLVKDLMNLQFIEKGRSLLIMGMPGTGKSHISTAYGILAVRRGYSVRFCKATKLLTALYATLADGSTDRFIARLARADLLIIDDLRAVEPRRPEYAALLLELVEARYQRRAMILSSNLGFPEWSNVLGNVALTTAIIDRLMHGATVINIRKGKSYRMDGPEAPPETDRPEGIRNEPDDE